MEERERKMKKSTKYLLIGTLVLFLSILGASVAYYLARVSGNLSGRAAGTELAINVEKLSSNATGDLIPLDNDLETLNQAAAGYDDNGACVDINGYSVCQIYHITLTNNGSVPLTINGTVTLSGQNVPNIDCARMNSSTEVANNNSCMSGMFVSEDTLNANDHNDYYVMVYINNLDEPQTDSGAFNGTVTFTTEDGRKVKGRFTKPFNLVQRIQTLYNVNNNDLVTTTTKTPVTNNSIEYNYATNVGLMNDRLGGTTTSLDGGNIRYYGDAPNNYIDIGDIYRRVTVTKNWDKLGAPFDDIDQCNAYFNCKTNYSEFDFSNEEECENGIDAKIEQAAGSLGIHTPDDVCKIETTVEEERPMLWRIIGVFDGKLRIVRDESIGDYSYDTSASNVNDGYGINEWSQADIMKLLNPGYETNTDFDSDGTTRITVNNSLYWNRESGKCYNGDNFSNTNCDLTNSGLPEDIKEYIVNQTIYLGGINTRNEEFVNDIYRFERGNDVFNSTKDCNIQSNCNDTVTRTTSWTGKVGLPYFSDTIYSADFTNESCQGNVSTFSSCTKDWLLRDRLRSITPLATNAFDVYYVNVTTLDGFAASTDYAIYPTLLLDSSVLAESGNGSLEHPYVVAY